MHAFVSARGQSGARALASGRAQTFARLFDIDASCCAVKWMSIRRARCRPGMREWSSLCTLGAVDFSWLRGGRGSTISSAGSQTLGESSYRAYTSMHVSAAAGVVPVPVV